MDLRGYETAKFALSELLQAAERLGSSVINQAQRTGLRDLLIRLAEDRFNIAVVGRFNRGKTSLMNAILGMDRLPTGIIPLTSVVTTVSYGSTDKVVLQFKQNRLDQEIKVADLARFITQQGNPGNGLGIATANIQLPAEILRRGFYLIDTPGIGSAIPENTRTTQAYLPEADALLLVTSFESPLSEEELLLFDKACQSNLPTFVVINKHDLATDTERRDVVEFVRLHLAGASGSTPLGIFSASARDGLAAKLSDDASMLHSSGLPTIEDALTRFLLDRKREIFLARMIDRVETLVAGLPTIAGIEELRQRVRALSRTRDDGAQAAAIDPPQRRAPPFSRRQLRACQICSEIDNRIWEFLRRYQYELSAKRDRQVDFANRLGFCCYHTREYQEMASPYGTCSGYPLLLERVAAALRSLPSTNDSANASFAKLVPSHRHCVVCAVRDDAEISALRNLAGYLRARGIDGLDEISALCLPHLAKLAPTLNNPSLVRALADRQALTLERTAEDMRRFTLKQSATRRYLISQEEETSAHRGLHLLVGDRESNFAVDQPAVTGSNQGVVHQFVKKGI